MHLSSPCCSTSSLCLECTLIHISCSADTVSAEVERFWGGKSLRFKRHNYMYLRGENASLEKSKLHKKANARHTGILPSNGPSHQETQKQKQKAKKASESNPPQPPVSENIHLLILSLPLVVLVSCPLSHFPSSRRTVERLSPSKRRNQKLAKTRKEKAFVGPWRPVLMYRRRMRFGGRV